VAVDEPGPLIDTRAIRFLRYQVRSARDTRGVNDRIARAGIGFGDAHKLRSLLGRARVDRKSELNECEPVRMRPSRSGKVDREKAQQAIRQATLQRLVGQRSWVPFRVWDGACNLL
jgi:hypothetical protein